jgi:hypothetical protein
MDQRVINERGIGKDSEGSGRGLILRYYPCIHLKGLRKTSIRIAGLQVKI